jgi:hypothetical protein
LDTTCKLIRVTDAESIKRRESTVSTGVLDIVVVVVETVAVVDVVVVPELGEVTQATALRVAPPALDKIESKICKMR